MISVEWDNPEKTVIVWTFSSPWTWDDFWNAKRQVRAMIETVDTIVDSIVLTSNEQKIPPYAFSNLRAIFADRHERNGVMIVVGSRRFLTAIVNLIVKILPGTEAQLRFAETREEAYAQIAELQASRSEDLSAGQ